MTEPSETQRNLELRLERSLRELSDIRYALDASAIVAITDRRGDINFANDNFCRISKYSREELLGQNHRIINSGYHPKAFFKDLWATIASGRVWNGEIRNLAKDGTYYWVDTTIVPLLDPDGRPSQYVSIRYDITGRKRLEAYMVRAAQMSLIGELAAGLAHEIKNPLAGIQGAVDVLIRRKEPGDPEREALENVRAEVARIDGTVRALLDRARPRAMNREPVSVVEVVRRSVLLARDKTQAAGRRVQIDISVNLDEVFVSIDAAQIEDAVLNLLLNALDAINGEGRIDVEIRRENGTEGQSLIAIAVRDTGRGIEAADMPRVFAPFFTTTAGGTGLGLPAVRRIARAHGGRVDVESTPAAGSTFTIRFPALRESATG